jgi:Cu2+-exporting ATPase/Cu+-exporting ATPase
MNQHKIYKVKGMHCASCAGIIERTFKKVEGVEKAEVNYGTESAKVDFDESKITPEVLSKKIEPLGYSLYIENKEKNNHHNIQANTSTMLSASKMGMTEDEHKSHLGLSQSKKEKLVELKDMRTKLYSAIPVAIISLFIMAWEIFSKYSLVPPMGKTIEEFFHHLLPLFATYILFVVGKPYLLGFYRFLRFGKANMDTLIGIGTTVAYLYSFILTAFEETLVKYVNVDATYYDITIIVITFITLGKYLESKSKIKTGDAIEKLLNLQAKFATVIKNGEELEVPIDEVVHGDMIVIKPGAKIPVDGTLINGFSYVDESMVTGEPMPVSKKEGENVVAGTINTTGAFTIKATKVGAETLLFQIIKMVEEAQGSKAPIQALADKISSVFVPIVIIISFLSFSAWLIFGSSSLGFAQALSFGLMSFVGVLVIACPCALGLATPTAIIVGVGKGAKEGILVKDARTLELLHKADTIVLDKTGTITEGKPTLVDIEISSPINEKDFMKILGTLEKKSEHPIAGAIINFTKEKVISLNELENFEAIKGKGVKGKIDEKIYLAGNTTLMKENGINFDFLKIEKYTEEGKTPVLLAEKDKAIGFVTIADEIKTESKEAIKNLQKLGKKVVILTGDEEKTAKYIGEKVGVDEIIARVLPEDKLRKIKDLQQKGNIVAMAGDGVNDAPALAQADIGIAMATGTDVAIESAGITLLHGDISKLVKAVKLSKITMRGIKQNLFWAFIYNIVGIPLATGVFYPLFGWLLNPVFAGFAMAMSSVSVVSNSLRLKVKKL